VTTIRVCQLSPAGSYAGLAVMCFVFPLQAVSRVYGFLARDVIAGPGVP
jgi:hypothetical protein